MICVLIATPVVYCCLYVVAVRMDAAVLSYVGRYLGAGAAAAARNADRLPSVASPILEAHVSDGWHRGKFSSASTAAK